MFCPRVCVSGISHYMSVILLGRIAGLACSLVIRMDRVVRKNSPYSLLAWPFVVLSDLISYYLFWSCFPLSWWPFIVLVCMLVLIIWILHVFNFLSVLLGKAAHLFLVVMYGVLFLNNCLHGTLHFPYMCRDTNCDMAWVSSFLWAQLLFALQLWAMSAWRILILRLLPKLLYILPSKLPLGFCLAMVLGFLQLASAYSLLLFMGFRDAFIDHVLQMCSWPHNDGCVAQSRFPLLPYQFQ